LTFFSFNGKNLVNIRSLTLDEGIIMDNTIVTMTVSFFEENVYQALRRFFAPAVPYLFPRKILPSWLTFNYRVEMITANQITVGRSLMAVPVATLAQQGFYGWAFTLFVIAGALDFVDGLVATVHRKLGFRDNPDLGAFLDAFCDKIFYIFMFILTLMLGEYLMDIGVTIWLFGIAFLSVTCEIVLAVVRMNDYYYNKFDGHNGNRDLKAKGAGKLKFMLELIGLGGLILSLPSFNTWSFWVGLICLTFSLPFALASLKQKLQQRQTTA